MDADKGEDNLVKIFSIKRDYTKKIYSKEKLVELRKQNVNIHKNEKCLIYTTSPVKKITGYFIVKEKIRLPIEKLWDKTKKVSAITRKAFFDYFKGCIEGTAIFFKKVKKFSKGISLEEVRKKIKGFQPPQSYQNLDDRVYSIIFKNIDKSMIALSDY